MQIENGPECICGKKKSEHFKHRNGKLLYCYTFDEVNKMQRGDKRIIMTFEPL